MISLEEAVQTIISFRSDWGTETIPLDQSLNRVLAEDIAADRDYPPFNRSVVDGFAVRSEDILKKHIPEFRVVRTMYAGDRPIDSLHSGEAVKIMTGAAVPSDADAVVMKEDAVLRGEYVSFNAEKILEYQHIASKGKDAQKGTVVISKHTQIHFGLLSVLASLGKNEVRVFRLPRAAIFSTGNEITPVDSSVTAYHIRDANSFSIAGFLQQYSISPAEKRIISDDYASIVAAIEKAIQCDMLIMSGGVSAGDADVVPSALKQCGVQEIFHNVKIRPGKPLWFGSHPNGLRVFALPGNPFSVQVACKIFIEPYIRACVRLAPVEPLRIPLSVGRKKKISFDEFFPAKLSNSPSLQIIPASFNGSGDITAIQHADGIAHHPALMNELEPETLLNFYSWKNIM